MVKGSRNDPGYLKEFLVIYCKRVKLFWRLEERNKMSLSRKSNTVSERGTKRLTITVILREKIISVDPPGNLLS